MFIIQKCVTSIKCRINYLRLSNSREYFFSTYLLIQLDVTYHDLVVLHLYNQGIHPYNERKEIEKGCAIFYIYKQRNVWHELGDTLLSVDFNSNFEYLLKEKVISDTWMNWYYNS